VLDALTYNRGVVPAYLSPDVDFYKGDVRDRGLLGSLLRRSTPSITSLPTRATCPIFRDSPT